jgi:hypothetical protein
VNAVAEMSSVPKTDSVLAKEAALRQFKRRRDFALKQENYNNEELPAGSPVYVYCKHCGILIERLPEDYLFPPFNECSQCAGLKQKGWLIEAKLEVGL